jgi:glycine/D-amino acid oxidase-like deaminating enzyme
MRQGVAIHGATKVRQIRKTTDGWRMETAHGTVTADKLILATNGYTGDLWPGLRRSLVPLFSAIAATEPLPEALAQLIMPSRSSLYEVGKITVYYRVGVDNRLLIGGRSVQRDVTAPEALHYLTDDAVRLWPALREIRWSHGWSGRLAATHDHYPTSTNPTRASWSAWATTAAAWR